jgi:integrase
MASVKFYLEKRRDKKTGKLKEKNIPILMHFHFDGQKMIFSTGEKVDRSHWNQNKQAVRNSVSEAPEINKGLEEKAEKVRSIYRRAYLDGIKPGQRYIREAFKEDKTGKEYTFFEVLDKYLEAKEQEYTKTTLKKVRSCFNHLRNFEKHRGRKITFDAIDESFLDEIRAYYYEQCQHTQNSVARNIKVLKGFLNWALKRRYHQNVAFQNFKVKETTGKVVFVTEEEFDRLSSLENLSYNFQFARDLFVFLWLTGLRVSDAQNLKKSNYNSREGYLDLKDWKTRKDNKYPLVDRAVRVIEEHKAEKGEILFPAFSSQVVNRRLKELGRMAGIDEEVTIVKFWKGERIERTYRKYELLSTKLGRKSFITNALLKGMDHETVMSFSNHNDYRTLQHYIGKAEEHKKREIERVFGNK